MAFTKDTLKFQPWRKKNQVNTTPQGTPVVSKVLSELISNGDARSTPQNQGPVILSPKLTGGIPMPLPTIPSVPLANMREVAVPRTPPTVPTQNAPAGYAPRPQLAPSLAKATSSQSKIPSPSGVAQTAPCIETKSPLFNISQRDSSTSETDVSQPDLNTYSDINTPPPQANKKRAAQDDIGIQAAHDRISSRRWNPINDDSICIQLDISRREAGMVGQLNWRYNGNEVTLSVTATSADHVSLRYSDFDQDIQIGLRRSADPTWGDSAVETFRFAALHQDFSDTFYHLKLSSGVVEPCSKGNFKSEGGMTHFWVLILEEPFDPASLTKSHLRVKYA